MARRKKGGWPRKKKKKESGKKKTPPAWEKCYGGIRIGRLCTLGAQREAYRRLLRGHISPKDRVLEIGAGAGWLKKEILPEGLKENWVELDEEADVLKGRRGARVGGDIFSLPFADHSLDAIVDSSCVQAYKPSRHRRLAREFRRVLKPGGRYIVLQDVMPNRRVWLPEYRDNAVGNLIIARGRATLESMADRAHTRFADTLSRRLERSGFRILRKGSIEHEGTFPDSERHREYVRRLLPKYVGREDRVKGFAFEDGAVAVLEREGREVPKGRKWERFKGRAIVAQAKED